MTKKVSELQTKLDTIDQLDNLDKKNNQGNYEIEEDEHRKG